MISLDRADLKIIELLQNNARMSLKDISSQVFLTSPAVSARIDKLERAGIIQGYHAQINREAFALQIKAFINVKVEPNMKSALYKYVRTISNVIQCDCVTGDYLVFMEVLFHDTQELDIFLEHLQRFGETKTQIVFSSQVEHRGLPMAGQELASA